MTASNGLRRVLWASMLLVNDCRNDVSYTIEYLPGLVQDLQLQSKVAEQVEAVVHSRISTGTIVGGLHFLVLSILQLSSIGSGVFYP